VYANFWIAIGSTFLAWQMTNMNGKEFNTSLGLFIFFATLFAYNFQRITRHPKKNHPDDSERVNWIKKNRILLILITSIAGFMGGIFSLYLNTDQVIYLVIPGLISIFYAIGSIGLRNIAGMKIVWIGLVWAFAVGMPMIPNKVDFDLILIYFSTFTFIVALCIPFDIRDLNVDTKKKKTIPQVFGVKPSVYISLVLFTISYIVWIYLSHNWFLMLPFLGGFWLIFNVLNGKKQELYYSGLIDGLIVVTSCIFIATNGI
jgi:hypothetical protein